MKNIYNLLIYSIIITAMSGLVYICFQHYIRISTNDIPLQLVEDTIAKLEKGVPPFIQNTEQIDISSSLSPYVVMYHEDGTPATGTGLLDGSLPTLPPGIFEYVRKNGKDTVSWQPRSSVRSAIVVDTYKDGFVMAGKSLRQSEKHIKEMGGKIVIVWLITMTTVIFLATFMKKKR